LCLKKVALLFCLGEARETSQIFSRAFKDFPGQQKNPGSFQDVATLRETRLTHISSLQRWKVLERILFKFVVKIITAQTGGLRPGALD